MCVCIEYSGDEDIGLCIVWTFGCVRVSDVCVPAYLLKTMNQEFRNDSPMRLIKWIVSLANSIISLCVQRFWCPCQMLSSPESLAPWTRRNPLWFVLNVDKIFIFKLFIYSKFERFWTVWSITCVELGWVGLGSLHFYACAIYIILSDDFFWSFFLLKF